MFRRNSVKSCVLLLMLGLAAGLAYAQAVSGAKHHNIVFQVMDDNPARWHGVLGIARNLKQYLGNENVSIEIVVHGGALNMVMMESEVADLFHVFLLPRLSRHDAGPLRGARRTVPFKSFADDTPTGQLPPDHQAFLSPYDPDLSTLLF